MTKRHKTRSSQQQIPVAKEQVVAGDWSDLLSSTDGHDQLRLVPLEGVTEAFLCIDLLSDDECRAFISTDATGFGVGRYNPFYRNNKRLIVDSEQLSRTMWRRMAHLTEGLTFDLAGKRWHATRLNKRWRFSRYDRGDFFKDHIDDYYREGDEQSILTLNIYLNENSAATRFLTDGNRVTRVEPRTGLALLFRQAPGADLLHSGEKLSRSVKYLMRCDVMFAPSKRL